MANRHANKKLRAAIRARMAETGEGYQRARARILGASAGERRRVETPPGITAELIEVPWPGGSITLAVTGMGGIATLWTLIHTRKTTGPRPPHRIWWPLRQRTWL